MKANGKKSGAITDPSRAEKEATTTLAAVLLPPSFHHFLVGFWRIWQAESIHKDSPASENLFNVAICQVKHTLLMDHAMWKAKTNKPCD